LFSEVRFGLAQMASCLQVGNRTPPRGRPKRERAVSEERTQPTNDIEEAIPRRRQGDGGAANGRRRPARRRSRQRPDVLLDVPNLEVEKITLEVDSLRAHISVLAELANLLNLSVGADVQLGRVKLEIDGVRAQARLKVYLDDVRAILEKALDTIGEHPEILETLSQSISALLREAIEDASGELDEVLEGMEVGDTVDEALKGRLEDVRSGLEESLESQADEGETRGALGEAGGRVRRVVDESGSVVEQTLDESGKVLEETLAGEAQGTQEEEQEPQQQATPAAERKAKELGVDLSEVEGTGSGGRITVRDVESAARAE
jgi:pyruvate/2-oxoglutarate dehydrogenase complex dihydrolipoamide acyltransferase (E2) component